MERVKLGLEKVCLKSIKRLEHDVSEIFKISETYAELKKILFIQLKCSKNHEKSSLRTRFVPPFFGI